MLIQTDTRISRGKATTHGSAGLSVLRTISTCRRGPFKGLVTLMMRIVQQRLGTVNARRVSDRTAEICFPGVRVPEPTRSGRWLAVAVGRGPEAMEKATRRRPDGTGDWGWRFCVYMSGHGWCCSRRRAEADVRDIETGERIGRD